MRNLSLVAICVVLCGVPIACGDTVGNPIVAGDDASVSNGNGTGDGAAADAAPLPDAAPDTLVATLTVSVLGQNCMPAAAPDPVTVQATLKLTNAGSIPVGPITVPGGRILHAASQVSRATFTANAASANVVAPGETVEIVVVKDASSLDPKAGCSTFACGQEAYAVEVDYGGPSVPAASKAQATGRSMSCVF